MKNSSVWHGFSLTAAALAVLLVVAGTAEAQRQLDVVPGVPIVPIVPNVPSMTTPPLQPTTGAGQASITNFGGTILNPSTSSPISGFNFESLLSAGGIPIWLNPSSEDKARIVRFKTFIETFEAARDPTARQTIWLGTARSMNDPEARGETKQPGGQAGNTGQPTSGTTMGATSPGGTKTTELSSEDKTRIVRFRAFLARRAFYGDYETAPEAPSGMTETVYPDGRRLLVYPDGTKDIVYPGGRIVTEEPSGQAGTPPTASSGQNPSASSSSSASTATEGRSSPPVSSGVAIRIATPEERKRKQEEDAILRRYQNWGLSNDEAAAAIALMDAWNAVHPPASE